MISKRFYCCVYVAFHIYVSHGDHESDPRGIRIPGYISQQQHSTVMVLIAAAVFTYEAVIIHCLFNYHYHHHHHRALYYIGANQDSIPR